MRVLLAEDDAATRAYVARAIELSGHEVVACDNGIAAWDAWRDGRNRSGAFASRGSIEAPFSLVLSDWMMPGMSGTDLCALIRGEEHGDRAFFLLMTAFDDPALVDAAVGSGVDDYLTKPLPLAMLKARIAIAEARMRMDAERRALREQAEAATVLKSRLIAKVSHELRTPLNGILGMASVLLDMLPAGEQRACVELMHASGESLVGIIDDLLDLGRIEAGAVRIERAPFDPRALASDIVRLFTPIARTKGLSLHDTVAPEVPALVLGDAARTRQVVTNLVGNALKFSCEGAVEIDVRTEHADVDHLVVEVRDRGVGVPLNDRERIFEPFIIGSRGEVGAGLGLAISRELATAMGGSLDVIERAGGGSTFRLTLPCVGEVSVGVAASPNAPLRAVPAGLRVLVIEDNLVNRLVAERMLARLGFVVDLASSGEEGIARFAAVRPDIVLMDCEMPGIDGFETTARLRETAAGARTPILAMTANVGAENRLRCAASGMDGFVSKPVTLSALSAAVVGAFDGGVAVAGSS